MFYVKLQMRRCKLVGIDQTGWPSPQRTGRVCFWTERLAADSATCRSKPVENAGQPQLSQVRMIIESATKQTILSNLLSHNCVLSLTAKTQQQQQNLPSRKVAAAAQTEGTVTVITVGDPDKSRAASRSHVTVSIPDMTQRKHASTSTRDLNAADDNASDAATGMTSTANLKDAVVATDQSSTAKLTRTASRKSMTSSRANVASSKSNLTTREQKRTVGSLGRSSHANLGSRINR